MGARPGASKAEAEAWVSGTIVGEGGSGGEGGVACGCSASGGALSVSWLVGLVALARRRRD